MSYLLDGFTDELIKLAKPPFEPLKVGDTPKFNQSSSARNDMSPGWMPAKRKAQQQAQINARKPPWEIGSTNTQWPAKKIGPMEWGKRKLGITPRKVDMTPGPNSRLMKRHPMSDSKPKLQSAPTERPRMTGPRLPSQHDQKLKTSYGGGKAKHTWVPVKKPRPTQPAESGGKRWTTAPKFKQTLKPVGPRPMKAP